MRSLPNPVLQATWPSRSASLRASAKRLSTHVSQLCQHSGWHSVAFANETVGQAGGDPDRLDLRQTEIELVCTREGCKM